MSAVTELTVTERTLLALLANGYTIAEAAKAIGIKPQSAKNRVGFAYSKLGVKNRFQAFMELGWMTPPSIGT
jgi:DNA-binding CsgD family transcriptional regulator